jgi:hypothetical protein
MYSTVSPASSRSTGLGSRSSRVAMGDCATGGNVEQLGTFSTVGAVPRCRMTHRSTMARNYWAWVWTLPHFHKPHPPPPPVKFLILSLWNNISHIQTALLSKITTVLKQVFNGVLKNIQRSSTFFLLQFVILICQFSSKLLLRKI